MEDKSTRREKLHRSVLATLAYAYEVKGDYKTACVFRKAVTPKDLPSREFQIFDKEMQRLEEDVFGEEKSP